MLRPSTPEHILILGLTAAACILGAQINLSRAQDTSPRTAAGLNADLAVCANKQTPAEDGIAACSRLLADPKIERSALSDIYVNRAFFLAKYPGRAGSLGDARTDLEAAIQDNTTALQLSPRKVVALVNRADNWRLKGNIEGLIGPLDHVKADYEHSIVDFNEALSLPLNQEQKVLVYAMRSLTYIEMPDFQSAHADIEMATAIASREGSAKWVVEFIRYCKGEVEKRELKNFHSTCRGAYDLSSCEQALQLDYLEPQDRTLFAATRDKIQAFNDILAACRKGSNSACDEALASDIARGNDQMKGEIEQLREAASPIRFGIERATGLSSASIAFLGISALALYLLSLRYGWSPLLWRMKR